MLVPDSTLLFRGELVHCISQQVLRFFGSEVSLGLNFVIFEGVSAPHLSVSFGLEVSLDEIFLCGG